MLLVLLYTSSNDGSPHCRCLALLAVVVIFVVVVFALPACLAAAVVALLAPLPAAVSGAAVAAIAAAAASAAAAAAVRLCACSSCALSSFKCPTFVEAVIQNGNRSLALVRSFVRLHVCFLSLVVSVPFLYRLVGGSSGLCVCGGSKEEEACSWSITRPHAYKKISARVVRALEREREGI